MLADGNFVIHSKSGRVVWESGTPSHRGAWLALQADADIVVYDSKGALWSTRSEDSRLLHGEHLEPGWYLESPNRLCQLVMQHDGNLVLYSASHQSLWASGTRGVADAWAAMQPDGNFVVYSKSGRPVWATGTAQHRGSHLTLADSAQVLVTSASGATYWATG